MKPVYGDFLWRDSNGSFVRLSEMDYSRFARTMRIVVNDLPGVDKHTGIFFQPTEVPRLHNQYYHDTCLTMMMHAVAFATYAHTSGIMDRMGQGYRDDILRVLKNGKGSTRCLYAATFGYPFHGEY